MQMDTAPSGLRMTESYLADFVLCQDPGNPDIVNKFGACLHGGALCTSRFLETAGTQGACIRYMPALATKRYVHVSDDFMQANQELAGILLEAMAQPGAAWVPRRIPDLAELVRNRRHSQRLALLFVGDVEAASEELGEFSNLLTASNCFENQLICKIDRSTSWLGACQR